jgi:hypothetical protein
MDAFFIFSTLIVISVNFLFLNGSVYVFIFILVDFFSDFSDV